MLHSVAGPAIEVPNKSHNELMVLSYNQEFAASAPVGEEYIGPSTGGRGPTCLSLLNCCIQGWYVSSVGNMLPMVNLISPTEIEKELLASPMASHDQRGADT